LTCPIEAVETARAGNSEHHSYVKRHLCDFLKAATPNHPLCAAILWVANAAVCRLCKIYDVPLLVHEFERFQNAPVRFPTHGLDVDRVIGNVALTVSADVARAML
jgi:hypothetical protein